MGIQDVRDEAHGRGVGKGANRHEGQRSAGMPHGDRRREAVGESVEGARLPKHPDGNVNRDNEGDEAHASLTPSSAPATNSSYTGTRRTRATTRVMAMRPGKMPALTWRQHAYAPVRRRRIRSATSTRHDGAVEDERGGCDDRAGLGRDPRLARKAMAVVGTTVEPPPLRARKVTIVGRRCRVGVQACRTLLHRLEAKGVAPWARPNTLAVKFIAIGAKGLWPYGDPGNKGRRTGVHQRASGPAAPPFPRCG